MSARYKILIVAFGVMITTVFVHSALAQDFLSAAEIKKILGGNTVKFPNQRGRGNVFMYFGTDGEVVLKTDARENVSRGNWSVNEKAQLCRERPYRPFFDVRCGQVTSDENRVTFFNKFGDVSFSSDLLPGRQLP